MSDVVTLTMNPSIDLFADTPRLLDDGKSRCQLQHKALGGGGINVARNLVRMGVDALAVFPAGGPNGEHFKQLLREQHTPFHCVDIRGDLRQNLAVTEQSSGKMYHLVFVGPELQRAEWQACRDTLAALQPSPHYLIVSGSLPPGVPVDFLGPLVTDAKQRGVRVILDTSGKALAAPMQAGVYLAKLNRGEFADLGYTGSQDYAEMLEAMGAMVARGMAEALIVTLDAKGALLATREGLRLHCWPPKVELVSHVGAGDSFVSALTWKLLRGLPLVEAFRYGVAAAAAKVQIPGNQLTDLELVEAMYQSIRAPAPGTQTVND